MIHKFTLWLRGWISVFTWFFQTIWKEYLVDLHLNNLPWHRDDYIAFAERWNGRFAMLAVVLILQLELIYKISIWQFLGFV